MDGPSKEASYLQPPITVSHPSIAGEDFARGKQSPMTPNANSSWFRKPDPQRLSDAAAHHTDEEEAPPLSPIDRDAELGRTQTGSIQQRRICGFSRSTFVIVLFFIIVIMAAAVGGGVGGSLFTANTANKAT